MKNFELQRMALWLVAGLIFYTCAVVVGASYPAIQTVLYKMGHVTTLAWVGYWIARQALGRIDVASDPTDRVARAVLVGAIILAGSMGL